MNRYPGLPSQPGLSLSQILQEAQHRWLRPMEVCEILTNFTRFKLEEEAPQKPQGGSVFLFDRKALRYFRKDGHNWRKKKDGKTVREAHERLKAGSKEVLHCYYAHGEDNEHFQRRSYWMLDRNLEHIVFVHYREVKEGNRAGTVHSLNGYFADLPSQIQEMQGILSTSPESSPLFSPQDPSCNTSEQTARMLSSQFDDCDSSDGTEQCLPPALDLPSDRYQEGTSSRVVRTSTAFSTENVSDGRIDLLKLAHGSSQPTVLPQDGGPTLTEAREFTSIQVKENQEKNDFFNRENPYSRLPSSLPAGFDSLEWNEPFKETAGSFAGLERQEVPQLLDQYSAPYQGSPLEIGFLDLKLPRPMRPTHNSMEGLFYSELQNETSAESAMKTQHGDLLHSESHKVHTKKNSSTVSLGQIQSEDVTCGHNGSSALGYEKLMWTQGAESQFNLPQDYLQQLDVTKQHASQKQPPFLQSETSRFNASSTKDVSHSLVYSQVFKDFQADSSFQQEEQEHLKKLDSFGRWINQEIAADNESPLLTALTDSTSNWRSAFNGKVTTDEVGLSQDMQLDVGLSLSLFQGQCFSIMEFSPDHAPSSDETKILVTGLFLETGTNLTQGKWCCMFGDVEVPAELLCPGVFKTKAPPHAPGRVSLYITQGNRTACSNIREFHYHADSKTYFNDTTSAEDTKSKRHQEDMLLQIRLSRLLLSHKVETSNLVVNSSEMSPSRDKLNSIMSIQDDWAQLEDFLSCGSPSLLNVKEQLLQKFMKEKLQELLLCNALEGGGSILDDNGLGILHMGAALGYEWVIAPLLSRGLNVNFRDAHGRTALHWAAFCGREKTVVALLAAGADPGAKADPTSDFPTGQTPADLAASCRHKGIAGYLAESSLTNHLSSLNIQECKMDNFSAALADQKAVQTISERISVKLGLSDSDDQHSMQDTLAAVRNATQAAARIQATFRAISFQRRQEADKEEEDEYGISGNQLLSIIAAKKPHKSVQGSGEEELQSAAVCIQQKFRGWKGRKEFLLFRQHVVKIQAHVRGNQVRSQYKKIIWSVGIVEKAILRWRRKGKGLRGFCKETPLSIRDGDRAVGSDGDEDFLKAGRKQIEAGMEKALARVRSMVKSPEARDQYRRLLDDFQKEKVRFDGEHSCDDKDLLKELANKEDSEMFIKET